MAIKKIKIVMQTGAEFSACRIWRYQLWRRWDEALPMMNVIGLNPSTADETKDDPTIRRCIGFARDWGFGSLYMTNLFAYSATLPKDMKKATAPTGPENDQWIIKTAEMSGLVIAAWGRDGGFRERDRIVCHLLAGHNLRCFRISEKTGRPEHPLYLPSELKTIPYSIK